MKRKTSHDAVLGISVTPHAIESVLLRAGDERTELVQRFARQRARKGELVSSGDLSTVVPGLKSREESDFTLQVGEGNGSNGSADLFLASEFDGLGSGSENGSAEAVQQANVTPFGPQLKDILAECKKRGVESPKLAFCTAPPDVSYVELSLPASNQGESSSQPQPAPAEPTSKERRQLLELLTKQHGEAFDRDRVRFVPMTPEAEKRRFLAIVPQPHDSVTATLEALLEQHEELAWQAQLIDSEVSLYASLARTSVAATEQENTAIVRVGPEDTLVLFFTGTQLRHYERLRSLTSYESPETVSSRVMLQQDEQKLDDLHHILILTEGHLDPLLEAFRKFYPNAAVEPLHSVLLDQNISLPEALTDTVKSRSVPAIGAGLRLLETGAAKEGINLLSTKMLRKRRRRLAVAWHTLVMLLVLFGVAFYFSRTYVLQEEEISQRRSEIQMLPTETAASAASPSELKARINNLQAQHATYTHALDVLDSLLVGSDKWSRMMETVTGLTNDISGLWIDAWKPQSNKLKLEGHALSRRRIASFARRLNGRIERLATKDIGEVQVYSFVVVAPIPRRTPRVALYLRDVADGYVGATPEQPAKKLHDHTDGDVSH